MSIGSILIGLAIVAIFVLINGVFVAAEFAVIRIRKSRVEEMTKTGIAGSDTVKALHRDLDQSVAGAQLGITLASLVVGWLGEKAFAQALDPLLQLIPGMESFVLPAWVSFIIAFTLLTMAHIIIGEQVPKFLAISYPEAVLLRLGAPFRLFCRITSPFLWLMNAISNGCMYMLGVRNKTEELPLSAEEFRILVQDSKKNGLISKQEGDLLIHALEFKKLTARAIMVPRSQVDVLREDMTLDEVLKIVHDTKHSKLPVMAWAGDEVLGVLNSKDFFEEVNKAARAAREKGADVHAALHEYFSLAGLIRQATIVPDTMRAGHLLEEMRSKHQNMVIVINEFGSMIGLVTMEDLIENLVGEIFDEYDDKPIADIRKTGEKTWVVRGEVTLFELNKFFHARFQCEGNNCTTIAGLVTEAIGHRPRLGETVTIDGFAFKVLSREGQAISYIELTQPG